jgi:hypothetical protein
MRKRRMKGELVRELGRLPQTLVRRYLLWSSRNR